MSAWLAGVQYAEEIGADSTCDMFKRETEGDATFVNKVFRSGMLDYLDYHNKILYPMEQEKHEQRKSIRDFSNNG